MTAPSSQPASARILLTSAGRAWNRLEADLLQVSRGRFHAPGSERHRLGMHVGAPVNADCSCDGLRMRRVQRQGDIDIVPAGVEGSWEDDADCQILQLSLHPSVIEQVEADLGRNPGKTPLLPRLQVRDLRIEAIGWAIKADLEAAVPSDPLYVDLLANALAVRLIEGANDGSAQRESRTEPKFSARQLRALTEFIEGNLHRKLNLAELATTAGVSGTRLKTLFRNSTGVSVHQYVIRRRVDHARALLTTTTMPAIEIALAAGFSHQSHMAFTMRRILGQTPGDIIRQTGEIRPKLKKAD